MLYGNVSGSGDYSPNTQVNLSATPEYGYVFTNWTSNGIVLSTANPFAFTVTSDTNIIANFVPDTFAVAVSANNALYGSVSGSANYPYMEQASLIATPQYGYQFANWTSNGNVLSTNDTFIFTVTNNRIIVANFVPNTFIVSVSANNAQYGAVSGSNTYSYNTQASLTATPQYGYLFANWTNKGSVISTINPFTFTVTSDTNIVANFVPDTFAVAVSANNALYGSVSGSGAYPYSAQASLIATPQYGYQFANWISNGIVLSTNDTFAFTVTSNRIIVANFVPNTFIVSVSANNAQYGAVSGSNTYSYSMQASLTATPQYGYLFANWTNKGSVISTINPFTFTVTSDTNIVANFVPDTFAVSVSANNVSYGNVSGSGDYPYLEQASLIATPQYGYQFANWISNGNVLSTNDTFAFTVTSNRIIVANFVANTFIVSVSANNAQYGAVSGSNTYSYSMQASLTATPQYGYLFANWTSNGNVISTANSFTFMVTSDTNIVANFVPDTFAVAVSANNALYGSVSGSANYPYMEQASLIATPQYGYQFANWISNGIVLSTNDTFIFTVTSNRIIVANFVPNSFTVSVSANNAQYGAVSGSNTYSYNTQASLTATPQYGYLFANWTNKGSVISTINPFTFTVTSDTNIVANFVPDTFAVVVSANNVSYGNVSGGADYSYRMQASLTATANTGYVFENWTSNGNVVSTDNPFTFTVTSDIIIVANFKATTGISETTTPSDIVLYPNPVEDILHIQSSATIEQATIYDMSGRIVHQVQMTSDIPVADLARGVYVIKIETKKGIEVRKIVKE